MTERSGAIAIIGYAGRFPGAPDLERFWEDVRSGREVLETFGDDDLERAGVPAADRVDPRWVRKGTPLEGYDLFDAEFFGYAPREAQVTDPQQRIFLELAWTALEHAGHGASTGAGVGVWSGVATSGYGARVATDRALSAAVGDYAVMIGNDKDFLSTRVSYELDLRGPSVTVQTACSTSLVAVVLACRALQAGECDLALAGGVAVSFPQRRGHRHAEGMILSPDGRCRPFDAAAQGTRLGAGAGVVVLRRLEDAIAERDTIHAVILGAACNNDGAAKAGFTAPSVDGQVEVIALAHALAGIDPRTIAYVEAHGTGTPLGDLIEIAALTRAFRASTEDVGFCRLGALKANIGHLDVAAGVAGLIKTVLALKHREIPPLANLEAPSPALGLEQSPFVASAALTPWPADGPRRAAVSAFGIGGTNAHAVLEEAPAAPPASSPRPAHLLVLSGKTQAALDHASGELAAHLRLYPAAALADVAATLHLGRRAFHHRRALVAASPAAAAELLERRDAGRVADGVHEGGARPVAFLFSGQGSQYPGMGTELRRVEPVYRDAFDRCAAILTPHLGVDLRDVVDHGAGALLGETRLAQPALFATCYALAALWGSWGIRPAAMLGHSIGEYVAAHLAGVMTLDDALAVVAERGRAMQACAPGAMAAVSASREEIAPYLADAPDVDLAALNAPGLVTLSGPREALDALVARLAGRGIAARTLRTSHAFHSAAMEPALGPLTERLARAALSPPQIPYVSNVTGTWITPEQATSPAYYAKHLRQAVLFEAGVRTLAADRARMLLEVGPGDVLATLARPTLGPVGPDRIATSLPRPRDAGSDVETMLDAAGRLWTHGAPLDGRALHPDGRRIPLPTYPFARRSFLVEGAGPDPHARPSTDDRFLAPTWSRDDGPGLRPVTGAWSVVGPAGPLRDAVARELAERGARVTREGAANAVFLGPAAPGPEASIRVDAAAPLYAALVAHAEGAAPPPGDRARVVVVTAGARSVLAETITRPDLALLDGPVLVLPREVPGLDLRAVDVELDDHARAAREIADEAARDDRARIVARRAGRRWVQRHDRFALPPLDPSTLPRAGVWIVTGGSGRFGGTIARWLARATAARLVVIGRAPAEQAARALEAAGGEVLYTEADVTDARAVRRVVDEALARFGRVDGLVHAAGVPGDAIGAGGARDVGPVVAPILDGLAVLARVLGETPLERVVLGASADSDSGARGGAARAGAAAVLAAFAESPARPAAWRRVVVLDWSSSLAGNAPDDDEEALGRAASCGRARVAVTPLDLERSGAGAEPPPSVPRAAEPRAGREAGHARPALPTAFAPPATDTERQLAAIWSAILGVEPLGVDDDFFGLGGHSLLATRVLARVDETFGVRLTLADAFAATTVRLLAARVDAARLAPRVDADHEVIEF